MTSILLENILWSTDMQGDPTRGSEYSINKTEWLADFRVLITSWIMRFENNYNILSNRIIILVITSLIWTLLNLLPHHRHSLTGTIKSTSLLCYRLRTIGHSRLAHLLVQTYLWASLRHSTILVIPTFLIEGVASSGVLCNSQFFIWFRATGLGSSSLWRLAINSL